jgi:CubicO group peptidase (beta-lactamase class C family)
VPEVTAIMEEGSMRPMRPWGELLIILSLIGLGGCGRDMPIGQVVSWEKASSESLGLDGSVLDALREDLAAKGTVYEWYARGHGSWRLESAASLSKSLVGGLALMVAVSDGYLGLDDSAATFIPYWADDSLKSRITIRQLATHSSGVEHSGGDRLRVLRRSYQLGNPDLFAETLREAAVSFEPGTAYQYSGIGYGALSYALASGLRNAPQKDILTLLRSRIMTPIGVPNSSWSIGYGAPLQIDGMHVYAAWAGGRYTARAIARVGQFMLQKGRWEGRQLIDSVWVERMVGYSGAPLPDPQQMPAAHPAPSVGWWTNSVGAWEELPSDAFAGLGAGGQLLLVVPSLDLVVVRIGEAPDVSGMPDLWKEMDSWIFSRVAEAVYAPAVTSRRTR